MSPETARDSRDTYADGAMADDQDVARYNALSTTFDRQIGATDIMAKTKTRKTSKRAKSARAVATRDSKRVPAFAYEERRQVMADELRHKPNRSASIAELFDDLESAQFRTPRRAAATFRYDQRLPVAEQLFERGVGNTIALRKKSAKRAAKRTARRVAKRSK